MRLAHIESEKLHRGRTSQPLFPAPSVPLSLASPVEATTAQRLKRRLMDSLAPVACPLKLKFTQVRYRELLPEWSGPLTVGYRFSNAWIQRQFLKTVGNLSGKRVLLPGANHNSTEVRDWFSRPIAQLDVLDIMDWGPSFSLAQEKLREMCQAELSFHHATLDALPLPDASVDVVETRAVLEHVGNMAATAAETARVLKPGGVALHGFGPLFFTHGGDHCIGAYGAEHGFDHLLLEEQDYRRKLLDEAAFDGFGRATSDARYWAINGIFSYLRPREYLAAFAPHFEVILAIGTINDDALAYRSQHPDRWGTLRTAGLAESDLLIGSMALLLRKRR